MFSFFWYLKHKSILMDAHTHTFRYIYSMFRDMGNLKRHVLLVHGWREDALVCPRPWCDQLFHVVAELVQHKDGCLKFCSACDRTFNRLDKFEAHLRGHETMRKRMK